MKIPYLGKIMLSWCKGCNVPILGNRCARCDGKAGKVPVTPPGDVRPAFDSDIEVINTAVERHFGCEIIPEGKIVLLNNAPGYDRFDEVIMDGRVAGVLKYDVKRQEFLFLPRLFGARMLRLNGSKKGYVEIAEDALPYILKGASVLMPGVVDFDERIERGDEVIVLCKGEVVGVGSARISGEEAKKQKKGTFVKVRRCAAPEKEAPLPGGQDWETVLDANSAIIEECEKEAMGFVKEVKASHSKLPKTVAFSGGKDSLATLLLVRKVIPDVDVLFTDTGIEFPETVEYTRRIVSDLGLTLFEESAGDGFWKGMEFFGPPGKDYRWCCKICKLGPTTRLILKHFPDGCVSFIGQRKYESETRARSMRIWKTPWIPIQVGAGPIQHWTALHVWLYIMREGVEANELYQEGMERLGCWTCPSSDVAELEILKRLHPEMWKKWNKALGKSGLTKDEIKYGLWRWRKPTGGSKRFAKEAGITAKARKAEKRKKSKFNSADFERAANLAQILGKVEVFDTFFSVNGARVLKDGTVESKSLTDGPLLSDIVQRAQNCFGCGVCLGQCESDAIELRDDTAWVNDGCTGCMKCHERCPIVRYG
ncbi:MAG: phosphoadenosine phosphosulfate reductase family protein [Candidatus Hydrothermarchaeaceae archaeon]